MSDNTWIPYKKGQKRGKCFHVITLPCATLIEYQIQIGTLVGVWPMVTTLTIYHIKFNSISILPSKITTINLFKHDKISNPKKFNAVIIIHGHHDEIS